MKLGLRTGRLSFFLSDAGVGDDVCTTKVKRTLFTDDLTGSDLAAVDFRHTYSTVDGKDYRLYSSERVTSFEVAVEPFVLVATKMGSGTRRRSVVRVPELPGEQTKMRAWARMNGYVVAARGRVSEEIQTAYRSAQG